jgi:hypothetical protein
VALPVVAVVTPPFPLLVAVLVPLVVVLVLPELVVVVPLEVPHETVQPLPIVDVRTHEAYATVSRFAVD